LRRTREHTRKQKVLALLSVLLFVATIIVMSRHILARRNADFLSRIGSPYKSLLNYSDELSIRLEMDSKYMADGKFVTMYEPPRNFSASGYVRFTNSFGFPGAIEIRSSGNELRAWTPQLGEAAVRTIDNSILNTMNYVAQKDSAMPVFEQTLKLYSFVLALNPYLEVQRVRERMKIVGKRTFDNVACRDVAWEEPLTVYVSQENGQRQYAKDIPIRFLASVSEDGLIRRVETDISAAAERLRMGAPSAKIIQEHRKIQRNWNISPQIFHQVPPTNCMPVHRLTFGMDRPEFKWLLKLAKP
jgi:hypothetical protein